MKMRHALLGYLAVTALPFYPFKFAIAPASPLASINYDGYANETHIDDALIKQVIVETCEMVTKQKRSDSAIINHVSGDIIEARQEGPPSVPTPLIIGLMITTVAIGISWNLEDNPRREAFTQNAVDTGISEYPTLNWVICHSSYSVAFDGVQGTDWGYTHHELDISFYRTVGYDLYWAKSGTFYRYGDGGFINWAYDGNVVGTDDGGATVHFGVIS